ncbi:GerMN domain-containing protein [Enterocloster lavalensis]|uniref:GerMN domain-containing protein n=1 Tax=Enterocloster lavalensis TaxID=460384 RepID=UPI0023F370CC|nr:GerMN domain-containing protein [Enterocloster lavalensis]
MREMCRWTRPVKYLCLILWAMSALLLGGCQPMADEEKPLEEGEYLVYYLDSSTTRLAPQPYRPQAKDADGIIAELMEQFQEVPADVDSQPALSDKVVFQKFTRKDQVLYLYFDANYNSMKPEREILCRAALTKMLTQVDGVDYINIYCADQPLMDRSGNPVGMLSGSDFIMNTSNVNAYEKTELTLYFADGDGGKLVQEKREVVHNINTSLEQLIVEQLIDGPEQEGHFATLPADLKILNLTVNDSVCYINFDSTFLNVKPELNEYIPIYSIVNSLCELTTVTKVRILVNGSQDVMFRDVVSLNTAFERNVEYSGEPQ